MTLEELRKKVQAKAEHGRSNIKYCWDSYYGGYVSACESILADVIDCENERGDYYTELLDFVKTAVHFDVLAPGYAKEAKRILDKLGVDY